MTASSAPEEFAAKLRALHEAADSPKYAVMVRQAAQQRPPVKLTVQSLSDWLRGKSVPTDPAPVRFLVAYLAGLANRRGHLTTDLDSLARLHEQARNARQASRGGRPPNAASRDAPTTSASGVLEPAHAPHADVPPVPSTRRSTVGEDEFVARLDRLPPQAHQRLEAAWRDDRTLAWQLVRDLTDDEDRPTAVIRAWAVASPAWLATASWRVQVAAAELAVAYGAGTLAAELLLNAAAHGAPRRGFWLAYAAALYEQGGDQDGRVKALDALRAAPDRSEPLASAVVALADADATTASRELAGWSTNDPVEHVLRTALLITAATTANGVLQVTDETGNRVLMILADELRRRWSARLATARADLLIRRSRRSRSRSGEADLREALDLAIRVRDEHRRFRGDSTNATALACHAALLLDDPRRVILLGTHSDDGATVDEAASPRVSEFVAAAALQLEELDLARDSARRVTDPAVRAHLDAHLAAAMGIDAKPHWRRAVELADDDERLAQALAGLAWSGTADLPRLDELAARSPNDAAEIQAIADVATGEVTAAIARLRPRRHQSVPAVMTLASAYGVAGRIDDQVKTLREAADGFGEPTLWFEAVQALIRAGRDDDADRELDALLATAPPQWVGRVEALRWSAHLAYQLRHFDRAAARAHAVLECDPTDVTTRWALIRQLVLRVELTHAWEVLTSAPEPLDPGTVADARIWVGLNQRFAPDAQMVDGCLRLMRRFADVEDFCAFVLGTIATATSVELAEPFRAELQLEAERFFTQWPDSRYLRRIQGSIPELVAQMNEMIRPTDEDRLQHRRVVRGFREGRFPLSLLAATAGRDYAEVLLRCGGSVLPARHADPAETAACAVAVTAALDHDVIIDTSAVAVLLVLPASVRDAAIGLFTRMVTTDDVLHDAVNSEDSLARRSTDSWVYDDRLDGGRFDTVPQAEADRLARDAANLRMFVERQLVRHPRPATTSFDDVEAPALSTWASIFDLAAVHRHTVWADDPVMRVLVRNDGGRAMSTPAVIEHLASRGVISAGQHEDAIRALIRSRIGDLPLDEPRLRELADEDGWQPGCVTAALGRAAAWTDPLHSALLLQRLTAYVRSRQPDAIPAWLYHAVTGAAVQAANPDAASGVAARLLAMMIGRAPNAGSAVAALVQAARLALAQTDDPDQPPSPDPLPTCVTLLRDTYARAAPRVVVAQAILAMFTALPAVDRQVVLQAILG